MSTKLKLLPVTVMLMAGAIASVMTKIFNYDIKPALWILVGVLFLFFILGTVLQKVIIKFEAEVAEEEAKKAEEEEGKVVEKEGAASDAGKDDASKDNGSREDAETNQANEDK